MFLTRFMLAVYGVACQPVVDMGKQCRKLPPEVLKFEWRLLNWRKTAFQGVMINITNFKVTVEIACHYRCKPSVMLIFIQEKLAKMIKN